MDALEIHGSRMKNKRIFLGSMFIKPQWKRAELFLVGEEF